MGNNYRKKSENLFGLVVPFCMLTAHELKQHQAVLWASQLLEHLYRQSLPGAADTTKIINIESSLSYLNLTMLQAGKKLIHTLCAYADTQLEEYIQTQAPFRYKSVGGHCRISHGNN